MDSFNWPADKIKHFIVSNGYLDFYIYNSNNETQYMYAGRMAPGTIFTGEYHTDLYKRILILQCDNNPTAKGKYIFNIKDESGNKLIQEYRYPITSEATPTTSSNNNATSYVDDAFIDTPLEYLTQEEYVENLKKGLAVKDLRAILGLPHQFLPTADPRIDYTDDIPMGSEDSFGRIYSEKIIRNMPLLLMVPGEPSFMASYNDEQKTKILGWLGGFTDESFSTIFKDERVGKYYSLKYAYTEYFHYVNAMLRSAAYFLGIENKKIDENRLGSLNWLYTTSTSGGVGGDVTEGIFDHGNLGNFLGPYAGSVAFYADAGTSVDDSFSNSTGESQIASATNSLSDKARELNFLLSSVTNQAGLKLDTVDILNSTSNDLQTQINNILGKGNILSNILGGAETVLTGGRIIFPEIWNDSSFSRSYSCTMKLVSPSGDKFSLFLNLLVPLYHLLAFTLPREGDGSQSYYSPFLVRAYYKGLFNVDMGVISGLSISKGDEGEWTVDGIPTVMNVSFEIKDLYDGMYMSKQELDTDQGILANITELDYIANSCGININDQEILRTAKMAIALGFTTITDKITVDIFGGIGQYFNQKIQDIFGYF